MPYLRQKSLLILHFPPAVVQESARYLRHAGPLQACLTELFYVTSHLHIFQCLDLRSVLVVVWSRRVGTTLLMMLWRRVRVPWYWHDLATVLILQVWRVYLCGGP